MRALTETVGSEGPRALRILNEGDPITNIVRVIKEQKTDLLVMGTHGHKGFSRLVLGSVTERIIHEAACPVLVVSRPRKGFIAPDSPEPLPLSPLNLNRDLSPDLTAVRSPEPLPLKTILLATDFSGSSDRALTYALRWASEWGGRVILLHAVEQVPPITRGRVDLFPEYNPAFEDQIAKAWEKIHLTIPEATRKRCEVLYEVRHGKPSEEILRVAEERDADLIVMGARGIGQTSLAWGSNSSAVVRAGTFPVLVVRQLLV